MTEDEIKEYARFLVKDHARDVEYMTIDEMAEEHAPGGEISDEEMVKVDSLIATARVSVFFPGEPGYGDE